MCGFQPVHVLYMAAAQSASLTDTVVGPSPRICKHVMYDDEIGQSKADTAPIVTDLTTEIVTDTVPGATRTHVMILASTHHHATMPAFCLLHADGRHIHHCSSRGDLVVVNVFAVAALLELGVLRSLHRVQSNPTRATYHT